MEVSRVADMDSDMKPGLEARIAELERRAPRSGGRESVETVFWAIMHNVFPDETRKHMKAAGREQLLAARSYLDHWIAKMDASPEEPQATRESIEVE
jgi:hypothetical protein